MGNQSSRSRVENIFNTHTDLNIEQKVEENCSNEDTIVNQVHLGSGNDINGGIHQNIDSSFSCRLTTTLDSIASSDVTNEQFTKMKTEMNQSGINFFQNQTNDQNAKNVINNMTDIDQLQSLIKSCKGSSNLYNIVTGGDNNTVNGGIHQGIQSAVKCMFDTDATLETSATTSSTSTTDQTTDMKQEGINPFYFLGSFASSAVVVVILVVLFLMMSGTKSKNNIRGNNSGSLPKLGNIGSLVSIASKMKKR